MKRIMIFCFATMLAAMSIQAAVPQTMSYQGVLKDSGGVIVPDDDYTFEFRLYTMTSGGTPVWAETQVLHVTGGLLNATLGAVTPIALDFDRQYWLGISIDSGPELVPRTMLTGAPYALNAQHVKGDNLLQAYGDVGIGTLLPQYNLHVYENVDGPVSIAIQNPNTGASSKEGLYFLNENGQTAGLEMYDDDSSRPQRMSLYNYRSDGEILISNLLGNIVLGDTGNVAIGKLTGLEMLDVNGAIKIGSTPNNNEGTIRYTGSDFEGFDGFVWKSLTGLGSGSVPPGALGTTLYHNGVDWAATANLYNDGQAVGINTASPSAELDIHGNGNLIDHLRLTSYTGVGSALHFDALNEDWTIFASNPGSSSGDERFCIRNYSKAQNVIVINSDNFVGITKNDPGAPLDLPGRFWDLDASEGDFRIGNDTYRLKFGVATGGLGAGSAGIRVQGGVERLILGAGASEVLELNGTGQVKIGSPTLEGTLDLYRNGSAAHVAALYSHSGGGGLALYDEAGNQTSYLTADVSGTGGMFELYSDIGTIGFSVNGNWGGYGVPRVSILGTTSTVFATDLTGNASVALPSEAVSAAEILDEAGAASDTDYSIINLDGTVQTIASRSITAPAAGYALVIGTTESHAVHTTGNSSQANFGVSDLPTGFSSNTDVDHYISSLAPSHTTYVPVTVHGLFEVAAGANTFYLLAEEESGNFSVQDIQLTIVYLPTAYGTVSPSMASGSGDDRPMDGSALTSGDIESEKREAEAFNARRIEDELAELRAEIEQLKSGMREERPEKQ